MKISETHSFLKTPVLFYLILPFYVKNLNPNFFVKISIKSRVSNYVLPVGIFTIISNFDISFYCVKLKII